MPNVGDYNQGMTIGTATIPAGELGVGWRYTISLTDTELHPPDLEPRVQLTPIGSESDLGTWVAKCELVGGVWQVRISTSADSPIAEQINYIIISRIEPKHIQDHTRP